MDCPPHISDVLLTVFSFSPQAFRDHNIDGSSLPLLTETHMTALLGMKLGPALKLKTVLRQKLGPERGVLCSHCAHCHQGQERDGKKQNGAEEPPPPPPRPGSGGSGQGEEHGGK